MSASRHALTRVLISSPWGNRPLATPRHHVAAETGIMGILPAFRSPIISFSRSNLIESQGYSVIDGEVNNNIAILIFMRWLLACQKSSLFRDLLRAYGHDAWTCDLEPSEGDPQYHLQMDAVEVAYSGGWDAMYACPECRYLCSSGQHRNDKPGQRTTADVDAAASFFMKMVNAPIKHKAIENSIGIMSSRYRKPDQIIQPYQFGDDASKGTCLWLENFPKLTVDPALYVQPRMVNGKPRWANQTDSGQNRMAPSPTRSADRARNYPGIVSAMAYQWGYLVNNLQPERGEAMQNFTPDSVFNVGQIHCEHALSFATVRV